MAVGSLDVWQKIADSSDLADSAGAIVITANTLRGVEKYFATTSSPSDIDTAVNNTDPSAIGSIPDFAKGPNRLLPAIAQCHETGEVLMMAWMNEEAFRETCDTGRAVYYSRSRAKLWRKGEESGHRQRVHQILVDCDADTILLKVEQVGAACHEGFRTCFFRQITPAGVETIGQLLVDPDTIYGKK